VAIKFIPSNRGFTGIPLAIARREEISPMQITQPLSTASFALIAIVGAVASLVAQSVMFAKASYAVVGDPRAIVTADFNHDGRPDWPGGRRATRERD
jgi:hypothetical protein